MNYAILLSGGTGTRTGADIPKQYVRTDGHMMVTYALSVLVNSPRIDKAVITADEAWRDEIIKDAEALGLDTSKIAGFASPGDTRQLSILSAIEFICGNCEDSKGLTGTEAGSGADVDTVLVHDAARPFITQELISACYDALPGYNGVMPVLPMKDTVYLSEDGKAISGLLDRSTVFAGQAPELFRLKPYYEAIMRLMPDEILKINGASEPAVMGGMKIAMIPGDEKNVKVTSAVDLEKYKNVGR
ncbi:MAG: 2-C-methyl-D-erythritol 4-phosphate cytidylyltransferase [Lachnospiraceae bacterium]|nr:2-C-methyl-D-erythritol 4-phosphate cytidylyltransferase [Lachnospiraceae bacterium]